MLTRKRTIIVRRFVLFVLFLQISFLTHFLSAAQPQMLQFGTGSCPTCTQIQPKINEFIAQKWPIQFIDVAEERNQNLARQFQIQAIPTFVLLIDSQEVGRFVAQPDPNPDQEIVQQQIVDLFGKGREIIKSRQLAQNQLPQSQPMHNPQQVQGPPQNQLPLHNQPLHNQPLPNPQQNQQQNPQSPENVSIALSDIAPSNPSGRQMPGMGSQRQPPNAPYGQNPQSPIPNPQSPVPNSQSLIPLFLSASVRLRINDPSGLTTGTGTIVETGVGETGRGEALVLTCAHIFRHSQGKGPVEVELFLNSNDRSTPMRSIKVQGACSHIDQHALDDDIAFVKFYLPPNVEARAVRLAPHDNLRVGQKLVSVGCDAGADPTIREHRILTLDKTSTGPEKVNQFHYIQVSGAPIQGRSGGGLFSAEGYLVGVCNTGDPGTNDGLFVPLHVVRKQLDRRHLSFVYKNPSLHCPAQEPQGSGPALASASSAPLALASSEMDTAPLPSLASLDNAFELNEPQAPLGLDELASNASSHALTPEEKATLEEVRRRQREGAEIILIVNRPGKAKSEIIKLENVSEQFLNALTQNGVSDQKRSVSRSSLTEQAVSMNRRAPETLARKSTTPSTKQREAGLRTQHAR